MSLRTLFVLIFCSLILKTYASEQSWLFKPADVNELHSRAADYRISYGTFPMQFAELRLPEGQGPFPVAIIIHGGCWLSHIAGARNTAALADALRDKGIATWNVEYRGIDGDGGWPGTFEDVANAADYLRNIAATYHLDLKRVIVIGHSAGGHLALWLGARHNLKPNSPLYVANPLPIKGVLSLGGVPDLMAFRSTAFTTCGDDVVGKLLGNTPQEQIEHNREASPAALLPLHVPQILIYGTQDTAVPIALGHAYAQKAKKLGDSVKVIAVNAAGHHEYIVPNSITWPQVTNAVQQLLK